LFQMYETARDLNDLQCLLDESMEKAGPHLRSIFHKKQELSPQQVSTYLQGIKHVAFSTVTSRGRPRVAPLGSVFLHGKFHGSTDMGSYRARHLKKRPWVNLVHFQGDDIAITVHGRAEIIDKNHRDFDGLNKEWVKLYGSGTLDWSPNGIYLRIIPETMFAHATHPEKYPEK